MSRRLAGTRSVAMYTQRTHGCANDHDASETSSDRSVVRYTDPNLTIRMQLAERYGAPKVLGALLGMYSLFHAAACMRRCRVVKPALDVIAIKFTTVRRRGQDG